MPCQAHAQSLSAEHRLLGLRANPYGVQPLGHQRCLPLRQVCEPAHKLAFNVCGQHRHLSLQLPTKCARQKTTRQVKAQAQAALAPPRPAHKPAKTHQADADVLYDAIIVGGGMGGLTTATQMAAKGARVLVLEK